MLVASSNDGCVYTMATLLTKVMTITMTQSGDE